MFVDFEKQIGSFLFEQMFLMAIVSDRIWVGSRAKPTHSVNGGYSRFVSQNSTFSWRLDTCQRHISSRAGWDLVVLMQARELPARSAPSTGLFR